MSETPRAAPPSNTRLVQGLGLFDATMIVAGSMIGSGIFIVSADISRQVGSAGWLLAVWLITGLLTLAGALCYGELAALLPRAGGQYVYLREAYSPLWGFLYGWTLFLVIQTGTIAAVAVAFAKFTSVLVPQLSDNHKLFEMGRFAISPMRLVALGVIALLTWSNSTSLRAGKLVQNTFTITKIASLLGLIVLGWFVGANASAIQANLKDCWTATYTEVRPGATDFISFQISGFTLVLAIGTAMVGSLFSSDAWNNVTFTAGEVRNPKRNLPLSLFLGVTVVSILYFLANVAYLAVLPLKGSPSGASIFESGIQFAANDRVGTAAAEVIFGPDAARFMAILIMISTFGCVNGLILAGARVYYAMANDGLFFRSAGKLNRNGVPRNGLVFQGIWTALLALSGTYNELLDYVIFAVLIFYVLTIAGLFVLRRKQPNAERPYKAVGYPIVPALYIAISTFIAIDLLISPKTRANTWPGLLIVLAGVPIYFFWRWLNTRNRT